MPADSSIQSSASRVPAPCRNVGQIARRVVPHAILVAFSATILLPLVWVLRVAVTDKATAYRIPPEWVTPRLDNFIEIFTEYPFATYFLNSTVVAIAATLIALPLAAGLGYAFARYNTGGMALRLFVLSSQMLPPVILVLPLFAMFLIGNLINTSLALILAHLTINIPFLAWIMVAKMKSLSVKPLILCVQIVSLTFPHARWMSGWWPCCSASSPTQTVKSSAARKSLNRNSRSRWCSSTTRQSLPS